jgi:hypothetical protein
MVKKTMESHVLDALVKATTIIATFDLWTSFGGFDTFALVVNYINNNGFLVILLLRFFRFMRQHGLPWQLEDLLNPFY